jgi:3-oxoacyl-[acyl-carrier protein] reductase
MAMIGRVSIVTGAGSANGIGFATARALVEAGASVLLAATTHRASERAAELSNEGFDAAGFVGDLTQPGVADELVATATRRWGRVDVVVNNAGMVSQAAGEDTNRSVDELTRAEWDDALARNLTTCFLVCAAVVPLMRGAAYGRIVNVSSVTGPVVAMPQQAPYSAAKAGMIGLTKALALEVAGHGITVNAVAPGWIDTASATDAERNAGARTPVGRAGRAREVAAAIAFLADETASYVTGTVLVVDGGNSVLEDRGGAVVGPAAPSR